MVHDSPGSGFDKLDGYIIDAIQGESVQIPLCDAVHTLSQGFTNDRGSMLAMLFRAKAFNTVVGSTYELASNRGTALMRTVCDEAREAGCCITIHRKHPLQSWLKHKYVEAQIYHSNRKKAEIRAAQDVAK
ncbi:hypothetical protein B7463_g12148, partial [Scytalidium lignicola]